MDYTAIGDCVNLAARLEAANKCFGTEILVADSTWAMLGPHAYVARRLGLVRVTGQKEPVVLWHVLGEGTDISDNDRSALDHFDAGLAAFDARDFRAAMDAWQDTLACWPDDVASRIYLEMARHAQQERPLDPLGYPTHSGKGIDHILWPWGDLDA
jgi:adenylate cyclase